MNRKMFRIPDEIKEEKLNSSLLIPNKKIRLTEIYQDEEKFEVLEFHNDEHFVKEIKKASSRICTIFGYSENFLRIYPEKQLVVASETFSGDDDGDWFETYAKFEYE